MKRLPSIRSGLRVAAQVGAVWADLEKANRARELADVLSEQDRAFLDAMGELQVVRDFVGSSRNILGRANTKHGEIAEQVHVGVTRAWDVLHGRAPTATFEGVPRTGPVDYRADGVDIQSKYYNGLRNTLRGVAGHLKEYPDFSDGGGRYHVPRDQHLQFGELRGTGGIDGLSDSSARRIQRRIDDLERTTGRTVGDLIEPGNGSYAEVQRGRIQHTLRDREEGLGQANEDLKQAARDTHGPSSAGFAKAAGIGAAASGGIGLAQAIWIKQREGRSVFRGEFSIQDWQDVGVVAGQGAVGGAVAGGTLYVLTNSTALTAPFAGSFVSALMGVGTLLGHYRARTIDGDQFVEMSHIVAMDAALTGLAAAAGQAMIPLPLLGLLLGSLAARLVGSALEHGLGQSESTLIARLAEYERYALDQLDGEFSAVMQRLDARFGNLERLAATAFDPDVNVELLSASVGLAAALGVPGALILRTTGDVDDFMRE
ncbi:MAG: hypothetical protein OXG35_33700 [Acidobacteria bacterium]|nr:hypothetical protein [Acidobacteriota bacterium]